MIRQDLEALYQEAAKLSGNGIIQAFRAGKETSYQKDLFYSTNRSTILRLVKNPKSLQKLPTKTQPRQSGGSTVIIRGIERKPRIKEIYIDDIDSFKAVKKVAATGIQNSRISEKRFKRGIQKILEQPGKFKDWGGEKGDLLTSRLRYKGSRIPTVFAFKGPGTRGTLTPKKMGKNGDQVQRLFESAASFFILQYWAEIGERVREQVVGWATLTSIQLQKKILFSLIDGKDTSRLIQAYSRQFS